MTVVMALVYARSMIVWGLLAYMFTWPVLIVMFVLGPRMKVWENRTAALREFKKSYNGEEDTMQYAEFNNVEDLYKQLEKK
jgi:hypothetical protein